MQIKELSEDDRPREKLLKHGVSQLTDTELLAIIIGSGTKGKSAIKLAQELLKSYDNNLNKIATQNPLILKNTQKGLGEVKCINIIAALELGKRRYIAEHISKDTPLSNPEVASKYLMRYLSDKVQEEFYAVLLNNFKQVLEVCQISKGNIDKTLVDIRIICKHAIINNATSVIIAHNHPSGNLQPSHQDIQITNKIKNALNLLDIELTDHLIIHQNNYYSFAQNNLL